MRIKQISSSRPSIKEQSSFDQAMRREAECQKAWHDARSASPFDKAAEIEAFSAYEAAIEESKKVGRGK